MYQVIDDQDEDDIDQPAGWSILPFILGALLAGLVFFMVWLFFPGQQATPGQTIETPASRAAYLKALSEPKPALRRARLMDFQRAYPDTDRQDAVEDQLDVINTAELAEWETLYRAVYSETLQLDSKRSAMANYETRWNGQILGGRGEELTALKQILDETAPEINQPDRTLEPGESPIPDNIPAETLAGAPPQMAVTFPIPAPPPPPPAPVVEENKDIIVQPRVRKNASPSYPRSAKRRKIGAVVTVSMYVNDEGKVKEAEVIDIEAVRYQRDFAKAAIKAAKKTKFHPKTINGEAVPAQDVRKRYIFKSN